MQLNGSEAKHDNVFSVMTATEAISEHKTLKKQEWTKIGKLAVMM